MNVISGPQTIKLAKFFFDFSRIDINLTSSIMSYPKYKLPFLHITTMIMTALYIHTISKSYIKIHAILSIQDFNQMNVCAKSCLILKH